MKMSKIKMAITAVLIWSAIVASPVIAADPTPSVTPPITMEQINAAGFIRLFVSDDGKLLVVGNNKATVVLERVKGGWRAISAAGKIQVDSNFAAQIARSYA